jgi:SAM-dependent methyltransferase
MSVVYRTLYALGITPWDNEQIPIELFDWVAKLPRGRALDVGCGTGTHAVWLAKQGFDVVGIDVVNKPIARAEIRAKKDGVAVRFVLGDAAASAVDLGEPFSLLLDCGCFTSVPGSVRDGLVRAYARHGAPGATLVLFSFPPRDGPGPKGAGREELVRRLGTDWELVETRVDEHTPVPKVLARVGRPSWYLWRRK